MLKHVDIFLGLLCWVIALTNFLGNYLPSFGDKFDNGMVFLPISWWCCIFFMLFITKRSNKFFWWVWLSLPVALYYWIIMISFAILLILGK